MATNLDKLSRINRRIINSLSDINIKTIQYWDLNENSILAMVKIWQLRYEIFVIFYKSPVSVCDYIRDLRYHRSISISYFFIKSCGKLFYQRRDLKKNPEKSGIREKTERHHMSCPQSRSRTTKDCSWPVLRTKVSRVFIISNV